ncbi:hypothetical protein CA13_54580 [Planctomycetes bacterium CA13]|uniref:Uncharacterized protein n=1 Tax=Novipirellula herctigrandis TaxID=2527986 RepID=A0A5C5Z9I4_9BACT|nr:hypothetical protein CA13_54580 [Planctomycetes bacterium CA13]
MWRSVFVALGIMAIIVGIEFLMIDSATLYEAATAKPISFLDPTGSPAEEATVFRPKDWMPWAFIGGGIITIVYSKLLPARFHNWRHSGAS